MQNMIINVVLKIPRIEYIQIHFGLFLEDVPAWLQILHEYKYRV